VLDGTGLSDADMAAFARWTNLSETTFILPATKPEADYRVRIFTPGGELPFAGHPTLGTCHAWLEAGGQPKNAVIVQECPAGLVRIRQNASGLAFAAPSLKRSAPSATQLAQIAGALGLKSPQIIAAQLLDNGTAWLGLLLDSTDTVLALTPNHLELKNIGVKVGVAGIYIDNNATQLIAKSSREARAFGARTGSNTGVSSFVSMEPEEQIDLEVRGFAAPVGVFEDPVTGSLNASLAQWLIEDDYMPASYVAAQGICLDRAGRVHISRDAAGQVWVGGAVVTCIDGMVKL
jgi:predicted PhzF superfamily epimerase YddE/YHI9